MSMSVSYEGWYGDPPANYSAQTYQWFNYLGKIHTPNSI